MYVNLENQLPDNVLRIVVDTEGPVRAENAVEWALSIVRYLQSIRVGDGEPDIEVRHLGYGSTALELVFLGAAAFAGVGMFALELKKSLEAGDVQTAQVTRNFAENFGGQTVTIICADREPITVQIADMPGQPTEATGRASGSSSALGYGGDPIGGDSASPVVNDDEDTFEASGRIVTTHGGRFAVFRTGQSEYVVSSPLDLIDRVPIGEDIVVTASHPNGDASHIEISDWRMASDDHIDWENEEGLPGIQVEKLNAIEQRNQWKGFGTSDDWEGETDYRTKIPEIKGEYPSPDSLTPPLSSEARVIDAADAHLHPFVKLAGHFGTASNAVLYFGTDKLYGPVANPDDYWEVEGPVFAKIKIESAASENKVVLHIESIEPIDSL
ncbi:hypothetical protein EB810_00530 [Altererythrobacter sp. FM1]|uniref:hypothetical protein n=1 Tax=Tsuneonella flava TaxID=2055955 RepID=UPI000C7FFC49|nr:hypothetical protein [Tsuneonella flava]ROT96489.1 hypothetical protein EB810_00530 [Altererythrobacter sp. FM1]